jgi:hypothetical protein
MLKRYVPKLHSLYGTLNVSEGYFIELDTQLAQVKQPTLKEKKK